MSRSLQDQFIDDDEEETCPLCVEEFDLTDKGFRPCPCGYQVRGPLSSSHYHHCGRCVPRGPPVTDRDTRYANFATTMLRPT